MGAKRKYVVEIFKKLLKVQTFILNLQFVLISLTGKIICWIIILPCFLCFSGGGVLVAPREQDPSAPGEMGRPVILPTNLTAETKKLVDDGWLNNAFNQYVSDLISVHRTLPDPRDPWWVEPFCMLIFFQPSQYFLLHVFHTFVKI